MDVDGNHVGPRMVEAAEGVRGGSTAMALPRQSQAKASGKLYVAGEYAVVEHGHPAILVGVDRWLTVHVSEDLRRSGASSEVAGTPENDSHTASDAEPEVLLGGSHGMPHVHAASGATGLGVDLVGRIHSEGHPEASVTWRRRGGVAVSDLEQPGAAFVLEAMHAVEELAAGKGKQLRIYDVNITSELDDASGRKYGLGSSAAVTVATVRALAEFYGLNLGAMQLYKLAFAAASRAQKVGSGGDIAASLFGGCIRFTAVDRQWVTERLQGMPIAELIDMPWPGLSIFRVNAFGASVPSADSSEGKTTGSVDSKAGGLRLLVGWTGNPASTSALVSQVHEHSAAEHERLYQSFLNASDACVNALAKALQQRDFAAVRNRMGEARHLLQRLSSFTGTLIETSKLTELIDIAQSHGAAAKSSGAGGGDCGIAILSEGTVPTLGGISQGEDVPLRLGQNNADAGHGAANATDEIWSQWRKRGILPLDLSVTAPQLDLEPWTQGLPATRLGRQDSAYAQNFGVNRKDDHIKLALVQHDSEGSNAFDDVRFVHHSLASVSPSAVDTSVTVCGKVWEQPFYINAMTGGSARAGALNASFARAAAATGLAIAAGSQSAALKDSSLAPSFTTIRAEDSDGFVFANIGPDVSVNQALAAVDMLHADALQIHLNAVQEVVMPEGSRDFSAWPEHIRRIVAASPVPVVVKEVGFGMSPKTVEQLAQLGVRTVDVSGRGGTDFAVIENSRRRLHEYGYMAGWGQSTVLCLLQWSGEARQRHGSEAILVQPQIKTVLASGGVRNPLDVVKALALGAGAVGVSGHFLHVLDNQGEQALIDEIEAWKVQVRSLTALLGAGSVADLRHTDVLVSGATAEDARLLGADIAAFARRSR